VGLTNEDGSAIEIELPPELHKPLSLTLKAHEAMDLAWDQLAQLAAETPGAAEVACAPGCAACCSYLVDTVSSEGTLIAASIENSPPAYKAIILSRLQDWEYEFERWSRSHPMPQRSDGQEHAHDLWRGRWQARRIACPFLNLDDNTCSIYADRPATCRGHHACYAPPDLAGEIPLQPPEGCFTSWEAIEKGELTPIWQLNSELCTIFSQVMVKTLDSQNVEWTLYFLPQMVLREGRKHFGWPPNTHMRRNKPPRITQARKEPPDGQLQP